MTTTTRRIRFGLRLDSTTRRSLIATQAFGESEIAGQIYGQLLAANGFDVSYQSFKDRAAIYAAIDSGDANFVPEYAASGLEFLNGNAGVASPDVTATVDGAERRSWRRRVSSRSTPPRPSTRTPWW